MIAEDAAAARHGKADASALAWTGDAVIGRSAQIQEGRSPSSRSCFAHGESGAGRRIDLAAMVRFGNLDVPLGPEALGRLLDQTGEQVDAEGEVGRLHH